MERGKKSEIQQRITDLICSLTKFATVTKIFSTPAKILLQKNSLPQKIYKLIQIYFYIQTKIFQFCNSLNKFEMLTQ